jgi:hypothetical protein
MQSLPLVSIVEAPRLEAGEWRCYLARLGGDGGRWYASVTLGSRPTPEGAELPTRLLHRVRYDADADEIEVRIGEAPAPACELRYFVSAPRAIRVEEHEAGKTIVVDDASGLPTMIHLYDAGEHDALGSRR